MIVHAQEASRREFLSSIEEPLRGPLPPSERDFEVFERVVIEGATTRAAAAEFGLSQTRIVQIRDRVAEWIASEVPATERLSPRQRLRLAASIASQRIDYLYSLSLEAWRASQGEQTVVRAGEGGLSCVTRDSQGDTRYLAMALRISLRQMDVAQREVRAEARGQEPGDGRPEPGARGQDGCMQVNKERPIDPPVRDCSSSADVSGVELPAIIDGDDASRYPVELSDEIESRRRAFLAALADDAPPVQPPMVDPKTPPKNQPGAHAPWRAPGVSRPMAESPDQPESDAMETHRETDTSRSPADTSGSPARSLRDQRRARQRLLERKLKARAK